VDRLRERAPDDVAVIIDWIPDAEALHRFAGPRLSWPLTVEQMQNSGANAGSTAWVFEVAHRLTGHAQLTPSGCAMRLGRVLVDPALRGRGHGRRLLLAVIEQALREGAQRVELSVMCDNTAAQHLYTSVGFVPTLERATPGMVAMTLPLE
jgi:RimJ/RimL family protein N-acetyltransferase